MAVPYRKYHGTGNDFAVVHGPDLRTDRSRFGEELCADLEADGVLFLDVDGSTTPPRVDFVLYQPDGSTAAMCGNGARVAARWAMERTGGREFVLDTPAGPRRATVQQDEHITVEMGTPTFEPADIPVATSEPFVDQSLHGFEVTAVNTGVPHAVAFVSDLHGLDIDEAAVPIRHADVFPDGANATFAQAAEKASPIDFHQRTYECGVEGETQSCGTGAVAIATVAARLGSVELGVPLTIAPPGGLLTVTVPEGGPATLEGPTAFEYEGLVDFEPEADR